MDPRKNRILFRANCIGFILLGLLLLTILFYLCEMPLTALVAGFFLCCALCYVCPVGEAAHALYRQIPCSLTMEARQRRNESTPLLMCSDLEAQSTPGNSLGHSPQNVRRSSPLPIPGRRSIQPDAEFQVWLAQKPWLAKSMKWYLEWRRKHVSLERRHTVSETVTPNPLNEIPRSTKNHTLSESAVQDFSMA